MVGANQVTEKVLLPLAACGGAAAGGVLARAFPADPFLAMGYH